MERVYRDNGAYGALLDEYEKSLDELKSLVSKISSENLSKIVDHATKDEDCRSIQTILSHVVESGYTYAIAIRKHQGESLDYMEKVVLYNAEDYNIALSRMMDYTIRMMGDYPNMELDESDNSKKLITRWGQMYSIEQLIEHAIVHILRHRRQIERFLLKLDRAS